MAAGIAAIALEVNPSFSWRDIQVNRYILEPTLTICTAHLCALVEKAQQ